VLVSVVIPTYNRRAALSRALAALARQEGDVEAFEVVVVSDGSDDGTEEYLSTVRLPFELSVITQPNRGPAAARNAGVEAARSELVLFLDDDIVAGPNLVASHLAAHRRLGSDAAVIGPMLTPPDHRMSPWVEWEQAKLERQYRDMLAGRWAATARQFYTGNASIRRAHVLAAGGFDPSYKRAEDVELAYRMSHRGVEFHFDPTAGGHHYAERAYTSWLAMARAYGECDVRMHRAGEGWLLPVRRKEFEEQHPGLRRLVDEVLSSPSTSKGLASVLPHTERLVHVLPGPARSGFLSVAFGLQYYQGLAAELGGWKRFLASSPDVVIEDTDDATRPIASVVIPAHDEGPVIERCLMAMSSTSRPDEFEVVVVANGCTDDTADRARAAMPAAEVIELAQASKVDALNIGDAACSTFPRVYLDADVVVDAGALRSVVRALEDPTVLCAAPRMVVEHRGSPWYVRAFYRAFLELPYVREGLVGNGFYAVSEEGRRRFDRFPAITADDLFIRNLFEEHERQVVEGRAFCMHPPRSLSGLLAIRRRVYRGNEEYLRVGHTSVAAPTRSLRAYARGAMRHPVGVLVYAAVNLWAKATWRAGSGAWERDESARRA
jgi:glycosyltransferase involved in cell wall biosynthesis